MNRPISMFPLGMQLGAPKDRPLKVVCVGAHPDDPETGCGGTLASLAAEGHHVQIVYLTRGEAGVRGKIWDDLGRVRSSEALLACQLLDSHAHFAGQVDRRTSADEQASERFFDLLAGLQPDLVFTHWPFDTHPDHRNASQLTYRAWQRTDQSFALLYYEVMPGIQTLDFQPNCLVDISSTYAKKRQAVYAHVSQEPDRFYSYHEALEKQRGAAGNCERAEAFFVLRGKALQPMMLSTAAQCLPATPPTHHLSKNPPTELRN